MFFCAISLQAQNSIKVYQINNGDSSLTPEFIKSLCDAVITKAKDHGKYEIERLISYAARDFVPDSTRSMMWHRRFGNECLCPINNNSSGINFLRLVVLTNFRAFANHIGPKNRTPIDFDLTDPSDSLNIYDFVNNTRKDIEAEHDNKRFEFQQDERWRNLMFFYFLFSEFYLKQY